VGAPPNWSVPDWARQGDPRIAFDADGWIHTYDTETGEVLLQIVEGTWPAWSPDNTKIAVRRYPGKIVSFDLTTGQEQRLGTGNNPDWSRSISEPECTVDSDCDPGICCDGSCFVPCESDASCDDSDICTIDTCIGAGSCDAYCEYSPSGVPGCCVPTHSKEKGPRCTDGLDNDCDGLIDAADPDCG
jgi:hypothetical protein